MGAAHDPTSDRMQDWVVAGLYDPTAPDAAERLELLEWIAAYGVDTAQMVAACAAGQLNALVGDLALRPGRRLTFAEVAAATGLSADDVELLWRSTGFPPTDPGEAVVAEHDLGMFAAFRAAAEFFSSDELVHFSRVMGTSMRRIAEAAGEMFLRDVEATLHQGRSTPLDQAKANLAAIELAGTATSVFEPLFRAHLELATQAMRRAREGSHHDFTTVPLAIGFVDLSGFTSRSGSLSSQELLGLVMAFESAAVDLVSRHGGRLIKLIGDEIMFSATDPADACAIAEGLVRHAATLASAARGGVAYGPVITSGGDVYGETVNLAARMVDIAVPGELLVNEATAVSAGLLFEPAGRRLLKGFAEPVRLWSLPV